MKSHIGFQITKIIGLGWPWRSVCAICYWSL